MCVYIYTKTCLFLHLFAYSCIYLSIHLLSMPAAFKKAHVKALRKSTAALSRHAPTAACGASPTPGALCSVLRISAHQASLTWTYPESPPKNWCPNLGARRRFRGPWGPYMRNPVTLGSILGAPDFCKLPCYR